MPTHQPASPPLIRSAARVQARVLASGVLVLAASVTLAVWGPAMDLPALPGLPTDTAGWAAAATLAGGLLLLALHGLMLRPLGRLLQPARPADGPAQAGAPAAVAAARTAPFGDAASTAAAAIAADRQAQSERLNLRLRAQMRALIDSLPQGAALSQDRRFVLSNAAFCEALGWGRGELHGRSPYEVFAPINADDSLGQALRTAFEQGRPYEDEVDFRRRDGSRLRAQLRCRLVDSGDMAAGTLWLVQPLVQPLSQTPAQPVPRLQRPPRESAVPAPAASRDALTGLLDAAGFEQQLAAWLQPGAAAASLLVLDLDRFKQINLSAGRGAGDQVLRQAAAVLQAHVREGDLLARLEDDCFAMLLPGCAAAAALQMGQRLHDALGRLGVDRVEQRLGVSATVGVAEFDAASGHAAAGAAAWMARARAAWYEAKYGGQGAVRLAPGAQQLAPPVPA